jgi:hypothetical protein
MVTEPKVQDHKVVPVPGPCCGPNKSSPHPHHKNSLLYYLCPSLSSCTFPSGFLLIFFTHFSSFPCMLHAPPISFLDLVTVVIYREKYKL